jgi:hypothetical protein
MFSQVLGRVFLVSPSSFEGLMSELAAQQQQEQQQQQAQQPGQQPPGPTPHPAAVFLDKWLTVSSARFIEEMMGGFCQCMTSTSWCTTWHEPVTFWCTLVLVIGNGARTLICDV